MGSASRIGSRRCQTTTQSQQKTFAENNINLYLQLNFIIMIITYRDRKRNIYMFDTIFMMLSFIDDVNDELRNETDGKIDDFKLEFNSIYIVDNNKKLQRQQAPVLLPEEETGETMDEYLSTQKILSKSIL